MEFIPGITLEVLLNRHKRLLPEQVGRLLVPICQALQAGHSLQVIHRDLKPANLMVMNPDLASETVKVMDFGLAQINARPHISLEKLRGDSQLYTCGTPIYIAPETARGDAIDHRSDLYSLGVILYELLIGKPPFYFEKVDTILKAHIGSPPPRFSQMWPKHGLSPKIEAVVLYCLEKYPNERPQTARKVAELFHHAMGQSLPGDSVWEEPEKKTRKKSHETVEDPLPPQANHPQAVVEQFDAWMPEPIAVMKLRGFVQDVGGKVLASDPGRIRVQLGQRMETAPPPPAETASALMRWMKSLSDEPKEAKSVVAAQAPIELLLFMSRKGQAQNNLKITVVMKPFGNHRVLIDDGFRPRCEKLLTELRAYLIANRSG
jgi:serine/threonine protein kinase